MDPTLQQWVMYVTAAIGLLRGRANIVMFSFSHMLVVQSMGDVARTGRPEEFVYLPRALFSAPNVSSAIWVLTVPTVLLFLAAVAPVPERWLPNPANAARIVEVPRFAIAIVVAYFVVYFFALRTVVEVTYASRDQIAFGGGALGGGIYVLAWSLAFYTLRGRLDQGRLSWAAAMALIALGIFLLDLLKGSTGIAVGLFMTSAFVILVPGLRGERLGMPARPVMSGGRTRAIIAALAFISAVAVVATFVRQTRGHIARVGVEAAAASAASQWSNGGAGSTVTSGGNGGQGAMHVLMCTALYDTGHSRDWRSIWGPIEYTFEPTVLLQPFGIVRSREAAWELRDYFIHLGGINTFGEFYWNGGYLCLIVMSVLLIGVLLYVDVMARRNHWWLAVACAVGPGLVQGYGYGYAQVFRGFANAAIFLLPAIAYFQWAARRTTARAPLSGRARVPSTSPR